MQRGGRIENQRIWERTEPHRDRDYPPGPSIFPIATSINIIIIAILWLAGVHQDRHGGYRTALRILPSIALSLIGAITAAKRIQWIHRASSDRLVLALAGASYWHAEIGIGIGPIAIAILWQTKIRIVVAALQTPSSSVAVDHR